MTKKVFCRFCAVLAGAALCFDASAGQITSGSVADASGGSVLGVLTPSSGTINNNVMDGVRADPGDDGIQLDFTIDWTSVAPVVVTFDVQDTAGITEYRLPVTFRNNTGVDWTGIRAEIGHVDGSGDFVAGAFVGLDFDTSALDASGSNFPKYLVDGPFLLSYLFSTVRPQLITDDLIEVDTTAFLNDVILDGSSSNALNLSLDVPDDPGGSEWQRGLEDYQFALRFTPLALIPEPTAGVVLGVLAPMLLGRRRG